MTETNLQLRFDGPELRAHEMDVTLLGPSLFAFGEMCKEANREINGERTKVRVLMKADIKANCVTIQLSVTQTIWESAKALVTSSDVSNAKTILEWLGIIGGSVGAFSGLIKFFLWKNARREESAEIINTSDGNAVIVKVVGDNNTITIPEQVYRLGKNTKVVESLKTVSSPVSESNGIEEVVFIQGKKEHLRIDKETAKALSEIYAETEETDPQIFTAHILIYSPVLDLRAKKWRFKFAGKTETIDISETQIAQDAIQRGSVNIGDTYRVKLEMIERKKPSGEYVPEYKIKEVLKFIPGYRERQQSLDFNPEAGDKPKK